MKTCPTCRATYPDAVKFCSRDGTPLPTTGASSPPTPKPTAPKARTIVDDRHVGRVIEGKYRLDSRIGEGAVGVVYKGQHLALGTPIAVKILRPELTIDEKTVRRFEREARISSQFQHAGIVKVTDFGQVEGSTSRFLVMDYVEGETLTARLERGPLPIAEATRILSQVAEALAHAHGKGVVHRDLKPDNVIVGPDGRAKILDFGIARHVFQGEGSDAVTNPELSLTDANAVVGTPHYMAPEQCQGRPVDARTDLYALGVMAYECLTGKLPFDAPTTMGVVLGHLKTPPPSPRAARSEVPEALDRLVLQLLAKEPDARPKDAHEVASRLHDAKTDARESRTASGGGSRRAVGIALVLAGLVVVGGVAFYLLSPPPKEAVVAEPTPAVTAPAAAAPAPPPGAEVAVAPADRDRDGVGDDKDACPDEPGDGEANGCPRAKPKTVAENLLAIADGAWPTLHGDAARSALSSESPLKKPRVKWRAKLRAADGSNPVVGNGLVYVGGYNGVITAIDAQTGQKRWAYTAGNEVHTTAAVSAKAAYFVTADGRVVSLDAQQGTLRWELKVGGEGWGSPALVDGVLYVQTTRRLTAITASTGVERWSKALANYTSTSPLVLDDVVFACFADGKVHAFRLSDGEEQRASGSLGASIGGLVFVNGTLVAAANRTVYGLDRDTLAVKWKGAIPDDAYDLSPGPNIAIARWIDRGIAAFDATTGRKLWTHTTWTGSGSALAVGDVAYLGAETLEAVRLSDGKTVWSRDGGQAFMSTPAQVNGVVFVSDVLGGLTAYEESP